MLYLQRQDGRLARASQPLGAAAPNAPFSVVLPHIANRPVRVYSDRPCVCQTSLVPPYSLGPFEHPYLATTSALFHTDLSNRYLNDSSVSLTGTQYPRPAHMGQSLWIERWSHKQDNGLARYKSATLHTRDSRYIQHLHVTVS